MRSRSPRLLSLMLVAAAAPGCGPRAAAPAPNRLAAAGAGAGAPADCPDHARDLRIVHQVEWYDGDGDGSGGGDAWVLHERLLTDEEDDLFGAEEDGMRPLTPEQARAHGAHSFDGDGRVWVLAPDGGVCEARLGEAIAVRRGDGMLYTEIARRVDGCRPEEESVAFALPHPPGSCRYVPTVFMSINTAESQAGGQPLPQELAALLPGGCDAPRCRRFWFLSGVTPPGAARASHYDLIVSDARPVAGESDCDWPVEDRRFRWARAGDGSLRAHAGEGNLDGALVDAGGVRLLLTWEPGRYFAYRTQGATVAAAGELTWKVPHEEDFGGMGSAGPYCGP